MKDVKSITANVDSITGDLAVVTSQLSKAPVDSVISDLQSTVAHLNELTAKLNDSNSSVGKMLNDPELYDNLSASAAALDSLLVDVKRNPKRYISIKVF